MTYLQPVLPTVSQAFDLFIDSIYENMNKRIYQYANKDLIIEKTGLGYDAALLGAATSAIKGMDT